jgi:NodT family efflux transporter outer membrane factor (OMF) lipoprotein
MFMKPASSRLIAVLGVCTLLSSCAITMPEPHVTPEAAVQWQAPVPHAGTVGSLSQWWQQQGDSMLVELIEAAQAVSPTVAQALSRIESARSNQAAAGAVLLPQVSASVAANRGVSQPGVPVATSLTGGVQAAWEMDLVGANRAVSKAALAQLEGTQAQWHDARVSVAAEVANVYYNLTTCQQLLAVARKDAASRAETARLSEISAKAGFVAPSVAAMARASAADGSSRVTQQSTACDLGVKALVALTGLDEQSLRKKVALAPVETAQAAPISIAKVPAQTIAQRPDVFAAERDVAVASAQVGSAKAQRYPRLTLGGNIGALRYTSMGVETNLDTWSFGPLALTLPLFDGGQRVANVQAAQARYTEVVSVYRARVRQAVREVEEALVNLHSTESQEADALVATQGYSESLAATQSRFGQGLASLVELEDARRNALSADSALLSLKLQRKLAWVSLYRALGGGFEPQALAESAQH